MSLLDTQPEAPKSKRLWYAVIGVGVALLAGFIVWYLVRFNSEKDTVERFMAAVSAENFRQAYQIWNPAGSSYTYNDFLGDFSQQGYYGPIASYRIVSATAPPKSNVVAVTVEVSPYRPFPASNDPKSGRDRRITLWVDRGNQSLSFPP